MSRLALACALVALSACTTPPRVETEWARRARAVWSSDTPHEPAAPVRAEYGPDDDRDDAKLSSLDREPDLGDVVVRLEKGVYLLEEFTRLEGARSVVIEGAGSHETRLEMQTETSLGLVIADCPRVTLRGLTLIGGTGGGIGIQGGEVTVEDCVFAGASFGLALDEQAVATVSSSVFAGCKSGIDLRARSKLVAREVAFDGCWEGISGRGDLEVEACAFFDGHDAITAPIADASLRSVLVAGERQQLGFDDRPRVGRALLVPVGYIRTDADRHEMREIALVDDFPTNLPTGAPRNFDIAGVHLVIERARSRGDGDTAGALRDLARAQAKLHAEAARDALRARDLDGARREAAVALAYWRAYPLSEAPEVLAEVAGLVQ